MAELGVEQTEDQSTRDEDHLPIDHQISRSTYMASEPSIPSTVCTYAERYKYFVNKQEASWKTVILLLAANLL
jgi:hypothetical protein